MQQRRQKSLLAALGIRTCRSTHTCCGVCACYSAISTSGFSREKRARMFGTMPKIAEPYTPTSSRPSLPRGPVRPVRRLVHHAEDGFGIAQQGLARVREHHAAGRALKELRADFCLQGLDLAGEGGLRQVQALSGAAQVAFFRYGYEIG